MKSLYITLFSFLLSFGTYSQDLQISTGFIYHKDHFSQTIDVTIPFTSDQSNIGEFFRRWMDDHYDYRLDGGKILSYEQNTFAAIGCIIPNISDQPIDLFLQVSTDMSGKQFLRFYASFGFDNYISRTDRPYEFRALYAEVKTFVDAYFRSQLKQNFTVDIGS